MEVLFVPQAIAFDDEEGYCSILLVKVLEGVGFWHAIVIVTQRPRLRVGASSNGTIVKIGVIGKESGRMAGTIDGSYCLDKVAVATEIECPHKKEDCQKEA